MELTPRADAMQLSAVDSAKLGSFMARLFIVRQAEVCHCMVWPVLLYRGWGRWLSMQHL